MLFLLPDRKNLDSCVFHFQVSSKEKHRGPIESFKTLSLARMIMALEHNVIFHTKLSKGLRFLFLVQ